MIKKYSNLPRLADLHCHLDLYADPVEIINETEKAEIYTIAVTTTPRAFKQNSEWTKNCNYIFPALGMHPQLVSKEGQRIELFEQLFKETKFIGEVGLDASPDYIQYYDLQKEIFKRILINCSNSGDKILTVHSLRAVEDVLSMINNFLPRDKRKIILHWFTGSLIDAQKALDLGCYFSINLRMAETKSGQDLIRILPLDRILTETDGPFLEIYGKPVKPKNVNLASRKLAAIHKISIIEMQNQIIKNLEKILSK